MAFKDIFKSWANVRNQPADGLTAVTPSDSVDLLCACRGLYVGTAGNVQVNDISGTTTVIVGVNAGQILPFRCTRIWETNTTAGSIVALY